MPGNISIDLITINGLNSADCHTTENIRLKNEFLSLLKLYGIYNLVPLTSQRLYHYGITIGERSHIELYSYNTSDRELSLIYNSQY